jgi:hypothetical protein
MNVPKAKPRRAQKNCATLGEEEGKYTLVGPGDRKISAL